MRLVEFHRWLDHDNALRVKFELVHGRVNKFVVQLECRFTNVADWTPVIRYDTAHGFAHCDRLHPYENANKIAMPTGDYNDALNLAINDLVSNWVQYRKRYEEWLRHQ